MRTIEMRVTDNGFEPSELQVQPGEVVQLKIKRLTAQTCATSIESPGLLPKTRLPLGQEVSVEFTATGAGAYRFGCGMNMHIGGTLVVAN